MSNDTDPRPAPQDRRLVLRTDFHRLLDALIKNEYKTMGPTIRDGAIVYGPIHKVEDLPVGWTDEQEAGTYRLKKRDDEALFGYVVGPHSWKKYLFPPRIRLWQAQKKEGVLQIEADDHPVDKMAFLGVRSCELQAIGIQDRVFLGGDYVDPIYQRRRDQCLVIAVQCAQAAPTCFCDSMGTGPRADKGFDLAVTELLDEQGHRFVFEVGSEAGRNLMEQIPNRPVAEADWARALTATEKARQQTTRSLDTHKARELLQTIPDHPRWDQVAQRCMSCANCTLVCPTCFCSTVEDVSDLTGEHAERWRQWDSCFTMDFSNLHGGSVRNSTKSRYRQWLTHKLSTWIDQFGSSGCVGCGRCITWCPVGIDLTEEVRELQKEASPTGPLSDGGGHAND